MKFPFLGEVLKALLKALMASLRTTSCWRLRHLERRYQLCETGLEAPFVPSGSRSTRLPKELPNQILNISNCIYMQRLQASDSEAVEKRLGLWGHDRRLPMVRDVRCPQGALPCSL